MKICNLKRTLAPLVLIFALLFFAACKEKQSKTEKTANTTAIASDLYTEKFRPQFHFSPQDKWMNDPNWIVYYKGKYHLFYQYYPEDIVWGPNHWGHAVSTDLHHWEHLPNA
jgi:fructan beta-fructosidase